MKNRLILLTFSLFLATSMVLAQDVNPSPKYTIKIGAGLLASYGTDFWSLENKTYYQPEIHLGIQYKNKFYLGYIESRYSLLKYDYAYGLERNINAIEIGVPFKKNILGLTIGKENYKGPSIGMLMAEHRYQSLFLGVIFDYRVLKDLSTPLRVAFSSDDPDDFGSYWHISLGLTGNISIQ